MLAIAANTAASVERGAPPGYNVYKASKLTLNWAVGAVFMKSLVVKRSLVIGSLKTSVSLENEFWESLKEIDRGRGMTVSELVGTINSTRINSNLSSTLRLFVLDFYRSQGSSELQLANAPASNAALERPGS